MADILEHGGEGGVEHHGLCIGIVEQIIELLGPITVVGIDRCHARLEGGKIGFEIFWAIIEEGRDLGLMTHACGQKGAT